MDPAPSSALLAPRPGRGGSGAVTGGGWVLMVDSVIGFAFHVGPKAQQVAALIGTPAITGPKKQSDEERGAALLGV